MNSVVARRRGTGEEFFVSRSTEAIFVPPYTIYGGISKLGYGTLGNEHPRGCCVSSGPSFRGYPGFSFGPGTFCTSGCGRLSGRCG